MKKLLLASLIVIGVISSASAVDLHPYIGFFPIEYSAYSFEFKDYDSGKKVAEGDMNSFALGPFVFGVKIADFRTDFAYGLDRSDGMAIGWNLYYDINVNESVIPYVKAGVLYGTYSMDYDNSKKKEEATNRGFAFGAGLGYKVTNNFIIDLGADYVIFRMKYKETKDDGTTSSDSNKMNVDGFAVRLGGRVQF